MRNRILANPIFHLILIALLGLLAYSNTFNAPFQWDEEDFIKGSPIIKDLSYFREPAKAEGHLYRSLLTRRYVGYLTFALNYKLHGFDVMGYHVVNILIHIINAILVYWFIMLTFRTPLLMGSNIKDHAGWIAMFTALLFVSHPLQTEAVTYIFQRLASLAAFFYMGSIIFYIKWRLSGAERAEEPITLPRISRFGHVFFYFLFLCSALLAVKTKENAFTLPVVITIYEFAFFAGDSKRRIFGLVPIYLIFYVILLISGLSPAKEIGAAIAPSGFQELSKHVYFFTELRVITTYIRLLLLPINQNLDYDYPLYHSLLETDVLLSFLLLIFAAGIAVYLFFRRGLRIFSFGIIWFFVTLSVESTIIPIPMIISEYRLYIPSVGIFFAAVSGMFMIYERLSKKTQTVLTASFLILIQVLLLAAFVRNGTWKTELSLWEDVVNKSPMKAGSHYKLASAYKKSGLTVKEIEHYAAAIKLAPDYADPYYALALAYEADGIPDKAIENYQAALRLYADTNAAISGNIYFALGNLYYDIGRADEAIENFLSAAKLFPDAAVHYNLSVAYGAKGMAEEVIEHAKTALKLQPDYADAYNNLGAGYMLKGEINSAIDEFQRAIKLKPDYADAHCNLGLAYLKKGSQTDAEREFKTVLRINPFHVKAQKYIKEKEGFACDILNDHGK